MRIGRYIFALCLASVLSVITTLIVRDLPAVLVSLSAGDPQLTAGMIAAAILQAVVGLPGLILLGYLLWRLVSFLFLKPAAQQRGMSRYIGAGVIHHLILFLALCAVMTIGARDFNFGGVPLAAIASLLAGAIWGLVFWKMDPRSTRNAARPAEVF